MSTDTKSAELIHPATGEVIPLDGPTNELADTVDRIDLLRDTLAAVRQGIADELARRLDTANARTETLGGFRLETNAPTEETYPVDELEKALRGLVEAEVLDPVVLERVIKRPPPKPVDPTVDKRELNKLKGHADPRVAAAVGAVRVRSPQRRTLKVKREGAA